MGWLIAGAVLGGAGFWFSSWARAKRISIRWYVWLLAVLAVLMAVLTAMDYKTMTLAMEPAGARVVLWLFGGPAVILALTAVGLAWRQNRDASMNPPAEGCSTVSAKGPLDQADSGH